VRVLFVCAHNICRSRVAEDTFRILAWSAPGQRRHEARSAGITPMPGGRAVTRGDVEWADVICVMERPHEEHIRGRWPLHGSKIRVLGIPDEYQPSDPALQEILATHIRALLREAAPAEPPPARAPAPWARRPPGGPA
jgi:predicted protein tyrosine phosphatase